MNSQLAFSDLAAGVRTSGGAGPDGQVSVSKSGQPHQNIKGPFQPLEPLWQEPLFDFLNTRMPFPTTGGTSASFGAVALSPIPTQPLRRVRC